MTAVEWYAKNAMKLEIERLKGQISTEQMLNKLSIVLKQAIEMEREHIIEAHNSGYSEGIYQSCESGERYYNETFVNKKATD